MLRLCAAALVVLAACSGGDKAWPDRPLVETAATIGSHRVVIELPKDVGSYKDSNGVIWRYVGTNYAFFVKVFNAAHPTSLDKAVESLMSGEDGKIVSKTTLSDGFEVIEESADNKRHTVHRWIKKGARAMKCTGILGRKIGAAAAVTKSNAWILRMCRSLKIN